jgi:hypothetical protein
LEIQAKVWIGGFKKPFFNLVLIPELLSLEKFLLRSQVFKEKSRLASQARAKSQGMLYALFRGR